MRYSDSVWVSGDANYDGADVLFRQAMEEMLFPFPSVKLNQWPLFTQMTEGFRSQEFTILCGATGVGKTTLLANWSAQFHLQGVPHFVASVETGSTDFIRRVMSALDYTNWNTGKQYSVENIEALNKKHGDMLRAPHMWLSKYTNRVRVEDLIADIQHAMNFHKVKVAIVDNLNYIMEVTTAANAVLEQDRVLHELVVFCKENDVHLILVVHPRKSENSRVVSEFDIKGSSTAVQEAHNVFLFNRPSPDLVENGYASTTDRELTIAKMRRLGEYVGAKLILSTANGVKYSEKKVWKI